MSWIKHQSSNDLRDRLEGIQNGLDAGTLSPCRRESDESTARDIVSELNRRDA